MVYAENIAQNTIDFGDILRFSDQSFIMDP